MNRLTVVCGMKWNWPASFTMWNTIRSAPVWYRIQPIGLGRAHGWQAKAPAPQLPQTLAKCRNSSRRLSAGVSRCEELAPGPKAPGTLENEGQPAAQAARGFHQHHLLAAHHAKRKIALRQHVAKEIGRAACREIVWN